MSPHDQALKKHHRFLLISGVYHFAITSFASSYILFMQSRGLSYSQIGWADAVYLIANLLLEIPTGVIADRYGRKTSVILSGLTRAIAMMIYFSSTSLFSFAWGAILAGLATALSSGALTAWHLDSVRASESEFDTKKLFSDATVVRSAASISGGLIGALMEDYMSGASWILASGLFLLFTVLAMKTHEEPPPAGAVSKGIEKSLLRQSLSLMKATPILQLVAMIMLLTELSLAGPSRFWQPWLGNIFGEQRGTNLLGAYWVLMQLATLLSGLASRRIESRPGNSEVPFMLIVSAVALGMAGLVHNPLLASTLLLGHVFFESLKDPLLSRMIHESIDARCRATVESLYSLIGSLGGAAGIALAGGIGDSAGIPIVFMYSAALVASTAVIAFITQRKRVAVKIIEVANASN